MANKFRLTKFQRTNKISIAIKILFGTGDALAQLLFPKPGTSYDFERTMRNAIYGGLIFAPIVTPWYAFLGKKVRYPFKTFFGHKFSTSQGNLLNAATRMSADQLIWAPFGVPLYFASMSLMQTKSLEEAKKNIREKAWTTLINSYRVWPLFQMANFYFVKPDFRLFTVNIVSIFWNCYMSFVNYRSADKTLNSDKAA
ncbi:hypothetical protein BRETT_000712 [Brettanomyces bruxellensis]|uniref:Protein SYM1 n=1 Tax=Dekkera bruxellensis TaxID=5007 RepID=A0A871RA03_DEKBR|nr:uncharacterized protein BRETT_000712 [Brettanomyces bruxellensis]QOU20995.1 hypothetical protein BRETT_000712 [Brettanomyces bruxellensis]